jgi:hypothetical protein
VELEGKVSALLPEQDEGVAAAEAGAAQRDHSAAARQHAAGAQRGQVRQPGGCQLVRRARQVHGSFQAAAAEHGEVATKLRDGGTANGSTVSQLVDLLTLSQTKLCER